MSRGFEERVRELFGRVAELPARERATALAEARGTDPETAAEVESLLGHHDRTQALLDRTPFAGSSVGASGDADPDLDAAALPARLGAYTLLRVIGSGGMGVVYEAEQASPRRRVAVKLIRPELVSPSMLRRFEHEAEALGLLQHPGIARVYEAGRGRLEVEGDAGQPAQMRAYIAMELVDGVPLTTHARRVGMGLEDRLALVAEVCDIVQFAHRRGVIHRDIKPANILVTADGRPHIVDFGVARLRGGESGAATVVTAAGQIVGSLAYMSPEQATGDAASTDSRSDIYSLGAVLFELICDRPPLDVGERSIRSALAAIQTEPPRIPRETRRAIGRDVEAILLRSLEKDPARRYQHASDVADDLRRRLRREPVIARTPSSLYQFSRFCARNREFVAAGGLVFATLIAAVVGVSIALARAQQERAAAVASAEEATAARAVAETNAEEATRNLQRFQAVSGFMHTLIGSIQPEIAAGMDTALIRSVIRRSEETLPYLSDQPLAMADAHGLLSHVYRSLGDFANAERHARRSFELLRDTLGEEHRSTAVAMHNLGALLRGSLRRYDEAEPLIRRSIEIFGELGEAAQDDRRSATNSLAILYLDLGRYAEALPILEELYRNAAAKHGETAPPTLLSAHNLAGALAMLGRLEESEQLTRRVYEGRAAVLGEDHPDTVTSMLSWSNRLRALGRFEEALELAERGAASRIALHGPSHHFTLMARGYIAQTYRDMGRLEEAHTLARELAAAARDALGPTHQETIAFRLSALEARLLLGDCAGGVDEALAVRADLEASRRVPAYSRAIAEICRGLAMGCDADDVVASEAEAVVLNAFATIEASEDARSTIGRRAADTVARFYTARGEHDKAAAWQARARLPLPAGEPVPTPSPAASLSGPHRPPG